MDKIEELKKLKGLFDNGFITQEEFISLKNEILGKETPVKSEIKEKETALKQKVTSPEKVKKEIDEIKKEQSLHEIKRKCKKCNKKISKYLDESNKGLCVECNEKSFQIPKWVYLFLLLLIPLAWWIFKDSSSKYKPKTIESSQPLIDNSANDSNNNYKIDKVVFKTFINPARLYKIDYPDNLKKGKSSQNYDGISFKSDDGKENLSVYSSILRYPTLKEKYNSEITNQDYDVTYKVFKGDWYAISGYLKYSNEIFYLKSYQSESYDEVRTLILTYPESKKQIYNSVLSKILDSFIDTPVQNEESKKNIVLEDKVETEYERSKYLISKIKFDFDTRFKSEIENLNSMKSKLFKVSKVIDSSFLKLGSNDKTFLKLYKKDFERKILLSLIYHEFSKWNSIENDLNFTYSDKVFEEIYKLENMLSLKAKEIGTSLTDNPLRYYETYVKSFFHVKLSLIKEFRKILDIDNSNMDTQKSFNLLISDLPL